MSEIINIKCLLNFFRIDVNKIPNIAPIGIILTKSEANPPLSF